MQRPLAERVDRLNLKAAGRFYGAGEKSAREAQNGRAGRAGAQLDDFLLAGVSSVDLVHLASSRNTRADMFAAAAFVKVRQRMREGGAPASSRRSTRCTSTWVLPEPALADTQAELSGFEARCCSFRVGEGISNACSAALTALLPNCRLRLRSQTTP